LSRQGVDYRTFELQVEAELAWRKAVVRRVRSTIKVGDDAVDEAINAIETNKGKLEYFVAEIFIPFDPNKSLDETYQNSLRLYSQVQKGANFNAIARSFSQSASAAKGGNLGWIRIDQVDENLTKIIVNMAKKSITKPINGADGYDILQLLNKRISAGLPVANVKVSLQQVFLPLRQNPSPGEVSAQSKLAKQISSSVNSCAALEKKGVEISSKQSGRLEVADLSRLPANIRNVVQNIPLSKASEPIRTGAGFLILMVCNRTGGDLDDDIRKRIRNMLMEKRAVLTARRMLRNIRRSAFVDIRR
jgi:peptidyl-prolyl cis-trans isomerase SurA